MNPLKRRISFAFAKTCSLFVAVAGISVYLGWVFKIDWLLNIHPSWPTMKANSAVSLFLLGISITIVKPGQYKTWGSRISQLCSLLVFVISLLTLLEHLFNKDLFIDEFFIHDHLTPPGHLSPGRMSLVSDLNFFFISICLFFKAYDIYKNGEDQYLLLGPIFACFFAIFCYLYASYALVTSDITSIALHTAVLIILACCGIIFIQPDKGWLSIALSGTTSGALFRNILIPNLFLFPAIGFLRFMAETRGVISSPSGISVMVTAELFIVSLAVIIVAKRLFKYEKENKKIQEVLEEKNKELSHINADLDSFVYTASHDLKAPVNNIESLSQMMHEELPPEVKDRKEISQLNHMIRESVQKFKQTIEDLSVTAKIGGKDSGIATVRFSEMTEETKIGLKEHIEKNNALIKEDFSRIGSIDFSRKNLRSILYNLVSNALKYRSPDRNPVIEISTDLSDGYILLQVKDNGLGIKDADKLKVFEMYNRLHTHVEGTGIGMGIVSRIVNLSGGKIEIESELGKGSAFKVFLRSQKPQD